MIVAITTTKRFNLHQINAPLLLVLHSEESGITKKLAVVICRHFNGKNAIGTKKENGERLIDFATANRLIAANASQARKNVHTTRGDPSTDSTVTKSKDYVLIQRRWQSAVVKCRTYPGSDSDSDHVLEIKCKKKLPLYNKV